MCINLWKLGMNPPVCYPTINKMIYLIIIYPFRISSLTLIIKPNPVHDFSPLDILFSDANFYTIQFKTFKSIMNECTNRNGHYSFALLVFGQPITDTANFIAKV